jgi:hypothetical protein
MAAGGKTRRTKMLGLFIWAMAMLIFMAALHSNGTGIYYFNLLQHACVLVILPSSMDRCCLFYSTHCRRPNLLLLLPWKERVHNQPRLLHETKLILATPILHIYANMHARPGSAVVVDGCFLNILPTCFTSACSLFIWIYDWWMDGWMLELSQARPIWMY